MLRVLACVFAITVPLLSQVPSLPFSLNGGGMQVQGTFTVGPGGDVCCSGVLTIGGDTGTFVGKASSGASGLHWRFVVNTEEGENYVLCIHVDLQGKLSGYYYVTGVQDGVVNLYP